jgi:hypothetical protein
MTDAVICKCRILLRTCRGSVYWRWLETRILVGVGLKLTVGAISRRGKNGQQTALTCPEMETEVVTVQDGQYEYNVTL